MNPIRPQLPPTTPPSRPVADSRAAFFQAVRGAAPTPPTAPTQAVAPRPMPQVQKIIPVQDRVEPAQPQRHLRPGSLIDIKV